MFILFKTVEFNIVVNLLAIQRDTSEIWTVKVRNMYFVCKYMCLVLCNASCSLWKVDNTYVFSCEKNITWYKRSLHNYANRWCRTAIWAAIKWHLAAKYSAVSCITRVFWSHGKNTWQFCTCVILNLHYVFSIFWTDV